MQSKIAVDPHRRLHSSYGISLFFFLFYLRFCFLSFKLKKFLLLEESSACTNNIKSAKKSTRLNPVLTGPMRYKIEDVSTRSHANVRVHIGSSLILKQKINQSTCKNSWFTGGGGEIVLTRKSHF